MGAKNMLLLELETVYQFVDGAPGTRNMREGQQIIKSQIIVGYSATLKTPDKFDIYAECMQSSKSTAKPHVITGTLLIKYFANNNSEADSSVHIEKMHCSCKAGAGQSCKHIVALLLLCSRDNRNNLPEISLTSVECWWKTHKGPLLAQFEGQPVKTFCCVNPDRLPALSENEQWRIRHRLIDCECNTAIGKHRDGNLNQPLPPLALKQIQNVMSDTTVKQGAAYKPIQRIPTCSGNDPENLNIGISETQTPSESLNENNENIENILRNAQNSRVILLLRDIVFTLSDCCQNTFNSLIVCTRTDVSRVAKETLYNKIQWKGKRQFRVTGSRCHGLFTYSKGEWPEKARKYFWATDFKTRYTIHGNAYEAVARDVYIKETTFYVQESGLVISYSEPWLAYSPDGIVMRGGMIHRLLEIKCPFNIENTEDATLLRECKRFLCLDGNRLKVKITCQYYSQIQCGMALLNLDSCDFVVYSSVSNTIRIITVPFDMKYANELLVKLKKNYFNHMIHQICVYSRRDEICKFKN